jgi:signal transduction histidine kinase
MIEAGRMELERTDVDLFETLTEAATMVASHVEDTEVALKVECDRDIGAMHADEKRIKQILFNLMNNALRFTEKGGAITVGAERSKDEIKIWVADTGRGIPYEQQAGAFDNFVSGDQRGAGLGLALVRSFVQMHDGWVGLESKPDHGTIVTCHFPASAAVVTPIEHAPRKRAGQAA